MTPRLRLLAAMFLGFTGLLLTGCDPKENADSAAPGQAPASAKPLSPREVEGGGLRLELGEAGLEFASAVAQVDGKELALAGGGLRIYDRAGKLIQPLSTSEFTRKDSEIVGEVTYSFGVCAIRLIPTDKAVLLKWDVQNRSAEQQLVKVALEWDIPAGQDVLCYQGRHKTIKPASIKARRRWELAESRFPLQALYADGAGLGAVLAADEFHSEWVPEIYPGPDGTAVVCQTIRIALDPESNYDGTFAAFSFSDKYAERAAVARYHELYPSIFTRNPDVDPRTHGICASYKVWNRDDAETARTTGATWDWCIHAYRRNGDYADSERFWDYTPIRPFHEEDRVSREVWLARQRKKFEHGQRANVAMFYYIISGTWAESQLASHFPDAIFPDRHAGRQIRRTRWGPPQDDGVAMLSWKTSYGKFVRESMKEIVDRLGPLIVGFGFDSPNGQFQYRGEALAKIKRKSWDEYGVYCRNDVAVAHLLDFVHTLKNPNGGQMGTVTNINGMGHYLCAYHTDAGFIEKNPWHNEEPFPQSLRYAMGEKTLSWWEGYQPSGVVDLNAVDRAQVMETLRGLADYTALRSLYLGIVFPHYFSNGVEYLYRLRPMVQELNDAGWRAIPACQAENEKIYTARYGEGLKTYLALGNPTAEEQKGKLQVFPDECGASSGLIFADYTGKVTSNELQGEVQTHLAYSIPTRKPLVFEGVAGFEGERDLKLQARLEKRFDRQTITCKLQSPTEGTFVVPQERGACVFTGVRLDGKDARAEMTKNGRVRFQSGNATTIELLYTRPETNLREEQIIALNAFDANLKGQVKILVGPDEDSRFFGERLLDCFRNYAAWKQNVKGLNVDLGGYYKNKDSLDVGIEVATRDDLPTGTVVLASKSADGQAVLEAVKASAGSGNALAGSPQQGVLVLRGETYDDLQKILYDYMDLLSSTLFRDYYGVAWTQQAKIRLIPDKPVQTQTASKASRPDDLPDGPPPAWLEPAYDPQDNLLQADKWTFGEGYDPARRALFEATRDTSTFHSPPDSLYIRSKALEHSAYWDQAVNVEPKQTYFLGVRVRPVEARILLWISGGNVGVDRFDERLYLIQTKPIGLVPVFLPPNLGSKAPKHEWRFLARSITIPENMKPLRLRIALGSYFGTGEMWFDDPVFLKGVPPLQLRLNKPQAIKRLVVQMQSTSDVIFDKTFKKPPAEKAALAVPDTRADERYVLTVHMKDGSHERVEYPTPGQRFTRR